MGLPPSRPPRPVEDELGRRADVDAEGFLVDGERFVVPDQLTVGGALRAAALDLVSNLWPLLSANVLWALACIVVALVVTAVGPFGLALAALLGIPLAGVFRVAARIQRDHGPTVPDSLAAWRAYALPALALQVALLASAVAFLANLAVAASSGDFAATVFATAAFWMLVAATTYALVAWPIVVDPLRAGEPLSDRLRLAAIVLLGRPGRLLALAVILFLLALAATLVVVLLTIGVAYVALAACRYVLPLADRLEQRATRRIAA
jgi:hypothetical protein